MIQKTWALLFGTITKKEWLIHGALFALTIVTTIFTGYQLFQSTEAALLYSFALVSILFAHEMGHYAQAKRYGVKVSLPYFIPMPIPIVGTMGAVIKMKSNPPDRRALFDIAFYGPLWGFILSLLFLGLGLIDINLSKVSEYGVEFADSILLKSVVSLFISIPEGYELTINPFVYAAWIGFFFTALNLFPIGQFDGGRIAYATLGKVQAILAYLGIALLIILSFDYPGWLLWVALSFIFKPNHPNLERVVVHRKVTEGLYIEQEFEMKKPLGLKRKLLAVLSLLILIGCFMPEPIVIKEPPQNRANPADQGFSI